MRPLELFTLTGDLGGLQILHVTADHPVQTFRGLDVAFHLSSHELGEVDTHQFHSEKVAGLVELKVLVCSMITSNTFFSSGRQPAVEGLFVAFTQAHCINDKTPGR
jgi:hypothetical protein